MHDKQATSSSTNRTKGKPKGSVCLNTRIEFYNYYICLKMEWQFQARESVGCWRCLVRWLHVPSRFKNRHQHSTALHLMGTNYAQGSVLRRTKTRNLWKMKLLITVKFWYPLPHPTPYQVCLHLCSNRFVETACQWQPFLPENWFILSFHP